MARIEQLTGRHLADLETRLDFLAALRAGRAGRAGPGLRVRPSRPRTPARARAVGRLSAGPRSVGSLSAGSVTVEAGRYRPVNGPGPP
ncbi:hypothetical protein ACFWJT_14825 [Streptomyces sp. NPDC127069]|uniref:hypothetical protein n=1 Tax=Streptomyces sp. NPDC127069 TaxID=3347128 RepID=UPI0036466258